MGTYRLLLALSVMLSHLDVTVLGHNPGVTAVVAFYVISGYVMTALIGKHYATPGRIPVFYLDRALRLYPQLLLYMVLTIAIILIIHPRHVHLQDLSLTKLLLNLLIVPVNFYQLDWGGLSTCVLLPWSLGLEVTFYLAVPFILQFNLRLAACALSVGVFILAYFGVLNTDLFGYRLLPGTLFLFLVGSLLFRRDTPADTRMLMGVIALTVAGFAGLILRPALQAPFNTEVIAGLLISIPAVAWLSRHQFGAIDDLLGNISYGVFLNHPLILYVVDGLVLPRRGIVPMILMVTVSVGAAWLSYRYIERPVADWRHRLRRKVAPAAAEPGPATAAVA